MSTRANGTTTSEPLYTFDDLEVGMRVNHRGEMGTIIEKGPNVVGGNSSSHIKIYFDDHHKGKDSVRIHENTINRYLKKKKAFWPDWTSIEKYTED